MHLFEAIQALFDVTGDDQYRDRGNKLYHLFATRLFDADRGCVPEYFDENWRPLTNASEQVIEPGHQFEWSWLTHRWLELGGPEQAHMLSSVLRQFAEHHGIDSRTGAVYDALDIERRPVQRTSRL